jgi:sec-independent protein translocase protein TatC
MDESRIDSSEEGMLSMSFLEHLKDLRNCIIRALLGFAAAFIFCVSFAYPLWRIIQAPAVDALKKIGAKDGQLVIIDPSEGFAIMFVKAPLVLSLFVAAPWILYQVWAFISPGLYKKERRWVMPFLLTTGGLFILGGLFAYFVAFRYGLTFLLAIGGYAGVGTMVSIDRYFELFVDVILGVSLVFELPVVIFFLTLVHIVTPRWLLKHSRYAILAIVIIAALITPTTDAMNMVLFVVPMCVLYFVGIFASHLLVLKREGRRFRWGKLLMWAGVALLIAAGGTFLAVHYHKYYTTSDSSKRR